MEKYSHTRGFTLIEILVVIGIIAVLAGIVIIAINPAKQFAQARNTERQSAVNSILNAIGQRMADNKGVFQGSFTAGGITYNCPTLSTSTTTITYYAGGTGSATDASDLSCLVPTYIATISSDPSGTTAPSTGYTVTVDTIGRVQVCAPQAANESAVPGAAPICVKG